MKRNTCICIAVILIMIAVFGTFATAARTLPPTNETTSITTRTSAAVIGNLYSHSDNSCMSRETMT